MSEEQCPICKERYFGDGKDPCVDCETTIKAIPCESCERLRDKIADLKERINDMLDMPKSALNQTKGEGVKL